MMIRALLVSITLLLLVIPTAAWIDSKITDNIKDGRYETEDDYGEVKDGAYSYFQNGATVILEGVNKDTFDPDKVLLDYHPPGGKTNAKIHIRLRDLGLLTRAIKHYRENEPSRIQREALRKRYEDDYNDFKTYKPNISTDRY